MSKTLTLRNVPDEVAEALRERAQLNLRSMQQELLAILEAAVWDQRSAEEQLAACRKLLTRPMTLRAIHQAIDEGRP
jgi:plasmid stability protein